MDVELFFHGVPNGEGFWGKEEDRNYFGTFYDHSSDEVKFLIQTRALKGKPYCYYNYLVYKTVGAQTPNVVANDGRDGSYFGMTIRFDAYCKDIVNMYRILDTVFNVYVMGDLLKIEKTKLKYTTPDFTSVSNVLKDIEKATLQLIQNAFSGDSFARLDGFAMNGGNCPTSNLYDCTAENVMQAVKQYSRVAISPYYPSGKEAAIQQQWEVRLKTEIDTHTQEKNEINASLSSTQNQVSRLQHEIERKSGEISQLNSMILDLKSRIKTSGEIKKVEKIVAPLKEPITELAVILKKMVPKISDTGGDNETGSNKSVIEIIKSIIIVVNLILLMFITGLLLHNQEKKEGPDESNYSVIDEKNDSLERENEQMQLQSTEMEELQVSSFDMRSVRIDIHNYNGGDMSIGMVYDVEALRGSIYGTWKGEGCKIDTTTGNPLIIKLTPTADRVKIIYCVGDKTKVRNLKAK